MPKNLGLYNDNLSTPRKKDVDACYGPNNAPPYPVTSVNGQTGDITVSVELPEHLVKYDTLAPIETTTPIDINSKVSKSGDTMTGALIAQNNTNYSVAQVRNIIISTSDPSGGNSGDIWIKYVE